MTINVNDYIEKNTRHQRERLNKMKDHEKPIKTKKTKKEEKKEFNFWP